MKLQDIVNKLNIEPLYMDDENNDVEVKGCYIGDLLSNVMAHAKEDDIWLTVQTHQNVVAVAHLLNMSGIIFVEGHRPNPDTIERAKSERIPIFVTDESSYNIGCSLCDLGLRNV